MHKDYHHKAPFLLLKTINNNFLILLSFSIIRYQFPDEWFIVCASTSICFQSTLARSDGTRVEFVRLNTVDWVLSNIGYSAKLMCDVVNSQPISNKETNFSVAREDFIYSLICNLVSMSTICNFIHLHSCDPFTNRFFLFNNGSVFY